MSPFQTYVQHMVAKNGESVCDKLMKQGGHIYVCGDVAMAADVNTTICESLQERMGYSKEQARECIKKLRVSFFEEFYKRHGKIGEKYMFICWVVEPWSIYEFQWIKNHFVVES